MRRAGADANGVNIVMRNCLRDIIVTITRPPYDYLNEVKISEFSCKLSWVLAESLSGDQIPPRLLLSSYLPDINYEDSLCSITANLRKCTSWGKYIKIGEKYSEIFFSK